uniref:Glycosyltransferase n=1 Tax=Araucaria cunninghamii TaxID=56994 RepID=A0A0D6QSV1_ARACU
MAATDSRNTPHILAIPFPTDDQLVPFLNISYLLASHGLSITLLTTDPNSPPFQNVMVRAESAGLNFRLLYMPFPVSPDVPEKSFPLLVYAFRSLADPIERWLQQQTRALPVSCIVSDFYLGWTQTLAAKAKIPRFVVHATSAFGVCVDNSLWTHLPHLAVRTDDEPFQVPDLAVELSLCRNRISRSARLFQKFDPVSEFTRENRLLNLQSHGIVVNTLYDLELLHINKLHETTGKPVWAVGPIVQPPMPDDHQSRDVQRWLDSREPRSVLYVCLSSYGLSAVQMTELAQGLEELSTPFVWVVNGNEVSDEFEEGVRDRGLVIRCGEAPQLALVLSHPSVGGFMTRCGWNSALASITTGVPMITWPVEGDQFSNSALVVELLKIGVQVWEGEEGTPSRDQVKSAVERVMGGGEEAQRALELAVLAIKAIKEEGSSRQSMEAFAEEIRNIASAELPELQDIETPDTEQSGELT